MNNTTLTPNATKTLCTIYKFMLDNRHKIEPCVNEYMLKHFTNNDFTIWYNIEHFCEHEGQYYDLQDYFLISENLLCALDFYIDNRMYFEDFLGFKVSKHMTTKIRKALYNVVF